MAIAPKIAMSESFLTALAHVPRPIQKKVREFTTKFRANPTAAAINYEALHGMRDPKVRTVRIDQQYRAVVVHPPSGDLYLLVWVDNHDEAMAWAKDKVFDVHGTTGAIQVVDMRFVDAQPAAAPPTPGPTGLFAGLSDDDLARVGLPTVLVPAVRALATDAELERLQPYLPPEAFEALYLVAAGYDLERAVRETSRASAPAPVDTSDFTAALDKPASQRQFRLVGSEAELAEMLDASLERWRVFLHPNQAAFVGARYRGPARVLGGAGTGKTVVAMHRARALARRYGDGTILVTTFNRNLAANIGGLLDGLCGAERARIEVANLHAWAMKHASQRWGAVAIATPPQMSDAWAAAIGGGRAALGWEVDDYQDEWRDVVQFGGVATRDAYLAASRAGCARPLRRVERAAIWAGLAAYRAELDRRGLLEWTDLVRKVRVDLAAAGGAAARYRAVVVDEAQDMDAEQWRLVRALAPDAEDGLFITGDAHQRIYGKPIVLSHLGIDIRGRSHRLKLNYRTTEQVLRWALGLVTGDVDDLDGGRDNAVGYRSLYSGPAPEVVDVATPAAEVAALVARVRTLVATTPAAEIAVVARTRGRVNAYASALAAAGVACVVLDGDGDGDADGVRVATMHRVKGLDFTHVIMHLPTGGVAERDPRERSLYYVAATRCRRSLTVLRGG